jgi:hypothetical protein
VQLAAMITMIIDHVGKVFFPDLAILRIIGRIAFPLYAFGIVQGFVHTRSRRKYLERLAILAAVSQLPFMFGLQVIGINVIGTFVVCLAALMLLERHYTDLTIIGIISAAGLTLNLLPFDYGAYALFLILIYQYMDRAVWVPAHFFLNVLAVIVYGPGWIIEAFSIIPTFFLVYGKQLAGIGKRITVPRWIWRSFYPAHMSLLAIILWIQQK